MIESVQSVPRANLQPNQNHNLQPNNHNQPYNPTQVSSTQGSNSPTSLLEDQRWYHGTLPRREILSLLKNEGDFLDIFKGKMQEIEEKPRVRATKQKSAGIQIVISVLTHQKPQHFIVVRGSKGWRIDEQSFPSVSALIQHYQDTKTPLTKATGTIIIKPVDRLPWLLDNRDVTLEKLLGSGQFGEVWKGELRVPPDGKEHRAVAIKRCTATGNMTDENIVAFLKEAKIMLTLKHEHIVQIYGVAADKPPMMIVMELCPGGSLDAYLRSHACLLPEKAKIKMCLDAAKGMLYLSSQSPPCIHRDLAARNCLLGANYVVKIGDFGMSRQGNYAVLKKKGKSIPMRWAAPECLKTFNFNVQSDVYSFGVVIWEIFADGQIPWNTIKDNRIVISNICQGNNSTLHH